MGRREPLAAFGPAPLEHQATVLSRHSGAEAMSLSSATIVGLERALRHR